MLAAKRNIDVVANGDLIAFFLHIAIGAEADDHRRLASAPADRADLSQVVCNSQQHCGAWEKLALKVGPKAIAHHRNAKIISDARQLPDLFFFQELGFVHQYTCEPADGVALLYSVEQVLPRRKCVRLSVEPDPRSDLADTHAVIKLGGQQHGSHATLDIVVRGLQKHGRLAGVHGRVVEVELGHAPLLARCAREGKMVSDVLVLQSYKPRPWPAWREACTDSVATWAAAQGYAYRLLGDELFDPIPDAVRRGCAGVLLPLTDLGRLFWMRDLLNEGWSRVIWLDADILIFDPAFQINDEGVGREIWITRGLKEGFRAVESVNNCGLSFQRGSADLGRCLDASVAAAKAFRTPPHPRRLGPDLFRTLHRDSALPIIDGLAMLSPLMLTAIAQDDPAPMRAHQAVLRGPVHAANLCGSMIADEDMALRVTNRLLADPTIISPSGEAPIIEEIAFG